MSTFEKLEKCHDYNDMVTYWLDEIVLKYDEVISLDDPENLKASPCWLALKHDPDGEIEFALFEGMGETQPNVAFAECILHGRGSSGLREMRHTYFSPSAGEKGYVFYLPISATIKALTHLKKYFDD